MVSFCFHADVKWCLSPSLILVFTYCLSNPINMCDRRHCIDTQDQAGNRYSYYSHNCIQKCWTGLRVVLSG